MSSMEAVNGSTLQILANSLPVRFSRQFLMTHALEQMLVSGCFTSFRIEGGETRHTFSSISNRLAAANKMTLFHPWRDSKGGAKIV